MTGATDSKERFSNRVADYVRYRPGYPRAVLELLRDECALTPESVVADVGSGTGILTRLLLENGNAVYGIEPNAEMRQAGAEFLAAYPKFRSVAAAAEATTMPDASVDFVMAAQAFHWFDAQAARAEFRRILRPQGWVAVIANHRKKDATPFLRAYEAFLRSFGTDYGKVAETYPSAARMADFFGAEKCREHAAPNRQIFDFDGLSGRLRSSSYAPPPEHPNHKPMLAALKELFDAHSDGGSVSFDYVTYIFYGHLS
jgi:ubiquinone/menaquinone biosynthesis C-methylase UbiE